VAQGCVHARAGPELSCMSLSSHAQHRVLDRF
jgi:hypothetical protein